MFKPLDYLHTYFFQQSAGTPILEPFAPNELSVKFPQSAPVWRDLGVAVSR